MASYNRAILIGRLVANPELKQSKAGTSLCTFSIAVDRPFAKEGEPSCDFLPIIAWRENAEFVSRYFSKGQSILVEGQIQVRSYKDNKGSTRYVTEIVADKIRFVDTKKAEGHSSEPKEHTKEDAASHQSFTDVSVPDEELPF